MRLQLLFLMGDLGRRNVGDIVSHFRLSRPAISHHLKVLKDAAVVDHEKVGQEVYYRLDNDYIVANLQVLADSHCAATRSPGRDRGNGLSRSRQRQAGPTGDCPGDRQRSGRSADCGPVLSQQSIRQAAQEFQQRYSHLHVLVNNAGAHITERRLSADGLEMNLAVNHLSAFLLTNRLLDTLRASTPARIVNVASNAITRTIDLLLAERSFVAFDVHGRAKLAMVLCTYALARKLAGTGVTVNALHPGITATTIVDDVAPPIARPFLGIIKHFLRTPEQGAQTALYLATSPEVDGVTGKYFVDGKQKPSVPISYDVELQERTWTISMELVGLSATARQDEHRPQALVLDRQHGLTDFVVANGEVGHLQPTPACLLLRDRLGEESVAPSAGPLGVLGVWQRLLHFGAIRDTTRPLGTDVLVPTFKSRASRPAASGSCGIGQLRPELNGNPPPAGALGFDNAERIQ
ncbi:MAG: SDR family NAD(P)-dependent oxidoreductase [Chloroflexota bacterium]|nr:SDR family NAD(P)-dependent oxidoreductase [Chloroflexota bacterium]